MVTLEVKTTTKFAPRKTKAFQGCIGLRAKAKGARSHEEPQGAAPPRCRAGAVIVKIFPEDISGGVDWRFQPVWATLEDWRFQPDLGHIGGLEPQWICVSNQVWATLDLQ